MDNESPALHLIGDETDAGVCADGVCAVPRGTARQAEGTEVTDTAQEAAQ
jgi:hypothetical protein